MKRFMGLFASFIVAGVIFFNCSGDSEKVVFCNNQEFNAETQFCYNEEDIVDKCGGETYDPKAEECKDGEIVDKNKPGSSSSKQNSSSSKGDDPNVSSSSEDENNDSSSSDEGGDDSSSSNDGTSSSDGDEDSSSSNEGTVSSSSSQTSVNNCAYLPIWCGDIAFDEIILSRDLTSDLGDGPNCVFATSISMLGNKSKSLKVNGVEVNPVCGQTGWGQQPCTNFINGITKADGGYYIYIEEWAGELNTVGGVPVCGGGIVPSSSSNQNRSSSSTPNNRSSSSVTHTLTCGNVPSTGTEYGRVTAPAVRCDGGAVSGGNITWTGSPSVPNWTNLAAGTYSNIRVTANGGNCNGLQATCAGTLTVSRTVTPSSSSVGGTSSGGQSTYTPKNPGNQSAITTQYWDACKPSCGWSGKGGLRASSCNISGGGKTQDDSASSCDGGGSFTCINQAPWKVGNVSFGYAAINDIAQCGECFQLDFPNGEVMVVMKSNIGHLNAGAAFDLMIPGGGVGDFDALSRQIQNSGVSNPDMGARYGGFRVACNNNVNCVKQRCESAFAKLPDLKEGCLWYANTLGNQAASFDNPTVKYQKVTCPKELTDRY